MMLGTAGYTAGLSVYRLIAHGVVPAKGPVLVTGATGGVGCISVAILSKLGYEVIAATGKDGARQFLSDLGAREIISRDEAKDQTRKGLLTGKWAGVVETVGGETLDTAIRHTMLEGAVASCGNVTSGELHTSIYPFILRGVTLIGINSAFTPIHVRQTIWNALANEWKFDGLEQVTTEVSLEELDKYWEIANSRRRTDFNKICS